MLNGYIPHHHTLVQGGMGPPCFFSAAASLAKKTSIAQCTKSLSFHCTDWFSSGYLYWLIKKSPLF